VDPGTYREQDEVDQAMCHDPIILAMRKLSAQAVEQAVLDQIKQQADQEMADALARANEAAWPLASDAYLDVQTSGAGQWF
jgi:pyruvate dehydrogenase E1 component alpha subunit